MRKKFGVSSWFKQGIYLDRFGGDSGVEDEESLWVNAFKSIGLPATNMYINVYKAGIRFKIRLKYDNPADLEEVKSLAGSIVPYSIKVINQGYYEDKEKYIVDIVWLESPEDTAHLTPSPVVPIDSIRFHLRELPGESGLGIFERLKNIEDIKKSNYNMPEEEE